MRNQLIEQISKKNEKDNIPEFRVGDTLRLQVKIVEGGKERLQSFEGAVIATKGQGSTFSVTLRKISFGEGVERTFLIHSPLTQNIKVVRHGKVRRSKLYYLRDRVGKATKVKERILNK